MILVHFQSKPFNIIVIQLYAPTTNAEDAEINQFYEELEDHLEVTPKKDVLFITGDGNAKVGLSFYGVFYLLNFLNLEQNCKK